MFTQQRMWKRKPQPTPVFLPGESQGQKEYTQKNWKEGQEIFYIKTHSNITHKSQRQKPPKCPRYAKWTKLVMKGQILHDFTYMRYWQCQSTTDRKNGGRQGLEGESHRPVLAQDLLGTRLHGRRWNPSHLPKPVEKLVPGVKRLGTLG